MNLKNSCGMDSPVPGMGRGVLRLLVALVLAVIPLGEFAALGQAQTGGMPVRDVTVVEAISLLDSGTRVRLRGTLLYETAPGWFCIADGTGSIRGQIAKPIPMKPGDLLELTSALAPADDRVPWLWGVAAANLGQGAFPDPLPMRAADAYRTHELKEKLDAAFVTLRGRVTGFGMIGRQYPVAGRMIDFRMETLELDDEGTKAQAVFKIGSGAEARFPIGTLAEFTGACRLESPKSGELKGYIQVMVPGLEHVRVIEWPPFWSRPDFQRWMMIVSFSAAMLFGITAFWLWLHRKKVKLARSAERNAELERALAKERELGEMKSSFVSLVSHEFRTPLGVIMSSVEVLREYFDRLPPEKRQRQLDMIFRSTKNLASLIEEVLLLGRVDEGRMQFKPEPLDLEKCCRALADEAVSATSGACPILFKTESPLAGAASDEALLRHILGNLLSNAVKYSEPGAPVDFTAARQNGSVIFTVRDRGIGIPPEDQAKLFTSFTRGSNVGNRPGTGLGLVLVQKCVCLHGGALDIQSAPGAGTTVTVRLPVFENQKSEIQNPQ